MKILYFIIILLLNVVIVNSTTAQTHSLEINAEPFMFFSKTEGTGIYAYKHEDEAGIYATSFYVGYNYHFSKSFSNNLKIGYLWTNEDRFNGFEISEVIRINTFEGTYFLTGFSVFFNKEKYIREFHIKEVMIPFFVVGTGIYSFNPLNIYFQYQIPLTREFKTSYFFGRGPVSYKLTGILKLGFGYSFDL